MVTKPEGKLIPATNDIIFKNLCFKNRDFLAKLISLVTNIDYDYLYNNMYLANTDSKDVDIYKHHNEQDIIVSLDNLRINIEMSINNKNMNIIKNRETSHKYAGNIRKKGDKYIKEYIFYQICIENYNVYNNNYLITETGIADLTTGKHEVTDNTFRVFHVNLKNIKSVCYNELDEVNKFFKLLIINDTKELETLSKGDEILEKAVKTIEQMNVDSMLLSKEEKEEILEYATKVGHIKDIEEAREEGKTLGEVKKQQEIARNMIKKGISLEDIMEITGLTKKEIEKL